MSPDQITVFVNAARVEVPAGATALDAVRAWNADAAGEVERGDRLITDSRGLPAPPDAPVVGGSIFRLVPSRARGEGEPRD
ncbi:MAG TPA: hypothetical protein VFS05_11550 [Gemmatimonadaceae bacterium]|nr:hypothetical protein [Gemmatimonadaceae bacterium]